MSFKKKLCLVFGHKWTYYTVNAQRFRCCKRCLGLQRWTNEYTTQKFIWVSAVEYTDKYAKTQEWYSK